MRRHRTLHRHELVRPLGDHDFVALDLQRIPVVLERVRPACRGERHAEADPRRSASAVRLVEAEQERVGVLGALDRVEYEVRVIDRGFGVGIGV